MIIDVTDSDQKRHSGGFGLFGYRLRGCNGAIGAPQFLIVQCQMALDPDAEHCFVDHHAGADVKQVVVAVDRQVKSPVFPLQKQQQQHTANVIFVSLFPSPSCIIELHFQEALIRGTRSCILVPSYLSGCER